VTLGRDPGCSVELPGVEASRRHARLGWDGPVLVVEDLKSRNGTFVDGERVERAPLGAGSLLRIGEWIGMVARALVEAGRCEFGEVGPGMMGGSKLAHALELGRRAAQSELPIVVEGATGTGKERVARAVHAWSERSGPFLAMNCAALPEALAEGELFGYRKGAFTGADRNHPGYLRAAHGGTLLLDEFIELPAALQAKLLRVLEEREVLPLGESRPQPVDVRVIVAAQEPLARAVDEHRLRADLFARLDGVTVKLPALRERIEDGPGLFACFVREQSGGLPPALEPRLIEQLCLYDWPFNVRELQLVARRLLALFGHERTLRRAHLPERLLAPRSDRPSAEPAPARPPAGEPREQRDERDLEALLHALRTHDGNVARASAAAGLSRQRAYRLMNRATDFDLASLREEANGDE
jgi:transcriptional regulator with PAS, ATPase and Fis domain